MADRVALGNLNGTYGLKVSKPGVNVLTAADKDLVFSSDWSDFSLVHQRGTLSAGSTASFTSLGYVPVAFFCALVSGNVLPMKYTFVGFNHIIGPAVSISMNQIRNNLTDPVSDGGASWAASSYRLSNCDISYIITNIRAV